MSKEGGGWGSQSQQMAAEKLPAGFRFHPTDEELVTYYLLRKVSDSTFTSKAVAVVDLNKSEPWDLPGKGSMGEKEWYFFSLKDRKYPTGLRTNRATESGYWKTTGKDKEIFGAGVLIGMKKTLVFYKGRAPRGEKSNWVMHEYRLENNHPFKSSKEEWVVCRVFQKISAPKKPCQETLCNTRSMVNEFGDAELPSINSIANSSSAVGQIYINVADPSDVNNNMNNWAPAASDDVPSSSVPWPSGLLLNPMNTLLHSALQLTIEANTNHFATYNTVPQESSLLGTDMTSNLGVSSSIVLECLSQQQPFAS